MTGVTAEEARGRQFFDLVHILSSSLASDPPEPWNHGPSPVALVNHATWKGLSNCRGVHYRLKNIYMYIYIFP